MKKEFYMKFYERQHGRMVAICDKDLCGKTLKSEDIEVHINPRFYNGEEADDERAILAIRSSFASNLFGKKIVELAIKNGLVEKEQVKEIDGVPHAHLVVMEG